MIYLHIDSILKAYTVNLEYVIIKNCTDLKQFIVIPNFKYFIERCSVLYKFFFDISYPKFVYDNKLSFKIWYICTLIVCYVHIYILNIHVNTFISNQIIQYYDIICIIYTMWSIPKHLMIYLLYAFNMSNPGNPWHPRWGLTRGASVEGLPLFNLL